MGSPGSPLPGAAAGAPEFPGVSMITRLPGPSPPSLPLAFQVSSCSSLICVFFAYYPPMVWICFAHEMHMRVICRYIKRLLSIYFQSIKCVINACWVTIGVDGVRAGWSRDPSHLAQARTTDGRHRARGLRTSCTSRGTDSEKKFCPPFLCRKGSRRRYVTGAGRAGALWLEPVMGL